MVRDKTKLLKTLKTADATTWQTKAAFILLRMNGIENALKYTNQVNRRNKKENPSIMQRVKMLKTHAPKEIPNGSLGTVKCQCKIEESGLHYVEFDCGWAAYVYGHEVEKI